MMIVVIVTIVITITNNNKTQNRINYIIIGILIIIITIIIVLIMTIVMTIRGSLVRKLPSYRRLSMARCLTIMATTGTRESTAETTAGGSGGSLFPRLRAL